jgi:hypothetical protein
VAASYINTRTLSCCRQNVVVSWVWISYDMNTVACCVQGLYNTTNLGISGDVFCWIFGHFFRNLDSMDE